MATETIMEQLTREAEYAQRSLSERLLYETYGKATMARQLQAVGYFGYMELTRMTVHFINTHARELEREVID